MKLKKIKELEAALPRKEIVFSVSYESSTPARLVLKEKASAELNVKPELLVVNKIDNSYGDKEALVTVHVYKKEEDLQKIEEKAIILKNTPKKEEGAE